MNASILDLRYKTSDILAALDKRESVTILYHGKPKGTIIPLEDSTAGMANSGDSISNLKGGQSAVFVLP